jgi:hypothetical protein
MGIEQVIKEKIEKQKDIKQQIVTTLILALQTSRLYSEVIGMSRRL